LVSEINGSQQKKALSSCCVLTPELSGRKFPDYLNRRCKKEEGHLFGCPVVTNRQTKFVGLAGCLAIRKVWLAARKPNRSKQIFSADWQRLPIPRKRPVV